MKNREIIKYVKEIREGNASGFEELYEAFLRLINFYGRKIGEDGSEELILFFTELLHSLDIENSNLMRVKSLTNTLRYQFAIVT